MITIKYTIAITNDDPLLPELAENAKRNEWWTGSTAEKMLFSKSFAVGRKEEIRMLKLQPTGEEEWNF